MVTLVGILTYNKAIITLYFFVFLFHALKQLSLNMNNIGNDERTFTSMKNALTQIVGRSFKGEKTCYDSTINYDNNNIDNCDKIIIIV